MKHAQAAIEFVLITVAMMLLATGVFIASQATYVELQQERVDQQVHSVFEQLENEFIIAQLVGEGYEREIRLPQTLNGVTYSIDTRLNQTAQGRDELSIYLYNNQEYLYFIRTPINGTLSKGRNLLLGGDVVQVRPIIPSMNCVGHWGEILHTQNRTFWQEESPAPGEECVSQVRVCTDTELSGTYEYLSCTQTPLPPEEPDNCTLPDGSTLEHGQTSEWFYSDTEVTSPETCDGVQYTCTNGELDHDDTVYIHTSCVESVTTPSAPTINSIDRTHNEFTVHFSAPSSDGGSAITDYQYRINGGGWTSAGTTFSPITISSLTPYTTYTIDIRAVNAAGAGAISNAFPQTTHPYATGGTVTHLSGYRVHTFTAVGTNTLTFQGGGGPVEYLIVAGGGGGGPENGGGGGGGGVRTGTVS
ncbi:MAG: fibronectin type III domain-containing protein, partial [Candidatus Woesearchaeota archaeon]